MTTVAELAQERFVAVTTYRRSGAAVSTPVWVVPDGDDLLVWTQADSGKVKRVRHDPRVDLAPCSRSGKVVGDAPHVTGVATVHGDDAALAAVTSALKRKYGVEYRAITTLERLVGAVRRRPSARVVLRIGPAAG